MTDATRSAFADADLCDEWPLHRLLTEVVGSGPNSADDMTRDQAREALRRVLAGDPDPTTLGAFLLANRWKRNTPTELAAFLDVLRDRAVETAAPSVDPVDCGANYDGKTETALLGVAAAAVAAAAGTPVVVHSADRVPADEGVTYRHVLDELGVVTDLAPGESADMVDDVGVGFYYQPRFAPGVHALLDRRRAMGVRTFLNTVETLANPANASTHLGSFFHRSFATKLASTLDESHRAGFERARFVRGLGGYDDVRPGRTTLVEWADGAVTESTVQSADLGVAASETDLRVEAVAPDSARLTRAVLDGDETGPVTDAVALNAALRIYARGDAPTVAAGLDAARRAIDDGSAAAVLADLRAFRP